MSEYCLGILTRPSHAELIDAGLAEASLAYKQRRLNAEWVAFFLADEWDETLGKEVLASVSRRAPVLWFVNGGDYGWGYSLWQDGVSIASLEVDYALSFNIAMARFEERYGTDDPFSDPLMEPKWVEVFQETEADPEVLEAARVQYAEAKPAAFGALGLTGEQLTGLTGLLNPGESELKDPIGQLQRFQSILGIEEMRWLSYDWADEESEGL